MRSNICRAPLLVTSAMHLHTLPQHLLSPAASTHYSSSPQRVDVLRLLQSSPLLSLPQTKPGRHMV